MAIILLSSPTTEEESDIQPKGHDGMSSAASLILGGL
jgi:hypothetical protein